MNPSEWAKIVGRIQDAYQREVTPETAAAWWEELRSFDGQEVSDAVRRVIRERHKLDVASVYQAIDANHKEQRDARERYESEARQRAVTGKRGVPPPPEFRKALQVFSDSASWENSRMRPEARDELDDLASKIGARGPQWEPDDDRDEYLTRDPSGTR